MRMPYSRYLCLFVHSGVQHILCFVCLRLAFPMLLVSLDCQFVIAISVFANGNILIAADLLGYT